MEYLDLVNLARNLRNAAANAAISFARNNIKEAEKHYRTVSEIESRIKQTEKKYRKQEKYWRNQRDEELRKKRDVSGKLSVAHAEIRLLRKALKIRSQYGACPVCNADMMFGEHDDDCTYYEVEKGI